jgi:ubiquinone/menaquinone biosynthesis C-methylase UbiE
VRTTSYQKETTQDAGEFRARQRKDWDSAAQGWQDWQKLIIGATRGVSERLVERAGIKRGDDVLDVAAGSGEPSLTAAKVVGPEGKIVATDISAGMLAFGRERAAASGIKNVEFIESGASSLDFPPQTFDAALSRWGIIFEPDAEAAAARVRGFLKPGAKMAISSWGSPDQVPFLSVPMMTAMQKLDVPPPPPGTPGPLSRPTPEAIGGLLEGGGFSGIEVEELNVEFEWESVDDFVRFVREIAPPITAMLEPHPPEARDETWASIAEAMRRYTDASGKLRLDKNLVLVAAGSA